jgi:hypothetical protein
MTLHRPKDWTIGVVAVTFALLSTTYTLVTRPAATEVVAIQFSDLSDAEIDAMLEVKAEMMAANDL